MKNTTLKEIVLIGLISVVFGVLYLLAVYAGGALTGVLTPLGFGILGYEPFYGIWFMAAIVATYILRKPGVGIITEIIAAVIEVLLGSVFGPMVFVNGLIQGAGVEAAFFFTKYNDYSYKTTCLAGVGAAIASFAFSLLREGYSSLSLEIILLAFVIRVVSAVIFTGIIGKQLCDSLNRSGVLNSYAIGRGNRFHEQ